MVQRIAHSSTKSGNPEILTYAIILTTAELPRSGRARAARLPKAEAALVRAASLVAQEVHVRLIKASGSLRHGRVRVLVRLRLLRDPARQRGLHGGGEVRPLEAALLHR